jgi:hypothetical protein
LRSGGRTSNFPIDYDHREAFENTGVNEYSLYYASGTLSGSAVIVLTSATRGVVTQTETDSSYSNNYRVHITYGISKISEDVPDEEGSSSCNAGSGWPALALLAAIPFLRKRG